MGHWYQPKSTSYSIRKVDVGKTVMKRLKEWRLACPPNELDLDISRTSLASLLDHAPYVAITVFLANIGSGRIAENPFSRFAAYIRILIDRSGRKSSNIYKNSLAIQSRLLPLDIYAHLFDEDNPEAAERLDEIIFQSGSKMVANG